MNGDGEVLRRGWCNRWYRLQIRVIFVCYFGFKLRVAAFGFFVTGVLLLCFDVLKKFCTVLFLWLHRLQISGSRCISGISRFPRYFPGFL